METVNFAKDLAHLAQPVLSICRVYPGTPLFDALDPTPEQVRLIDEQMLHAAHKKLSGNPNFYGDFFSSEKVARLFYMFRTIFSKYSGKNILPESLHRIQ